MYLPIRYAPLEIELTIVSDADEPVIKGASSASANTIGGDRGGAYFTEGDTITRWSLDNKYFESGVRKFGFGCQ